MATETQTTPDLSILNRIGSIPLVSSSLNAVHNTLQGHRLTATPYATATAVSAYALGTANKYSAPLQTRLAPLVARADGYANAAVDAVEARYPYPFRASPDDVYNDLTKRTEEAKGAAHKTIDDRVYTPANRVVAGIDQRFTPLVDYLEVYVNKLSPPTSPPESPSTSNASAPASYQYQRAYALTLSLRDSLYATSSAQIKQLQDQSVLIQRATQTAQSLTGAAQSNAAAVHARVNQLSETMVSDLQTVKRATAQLPAHVQEGLAVLSRELNGTLHDLSAIVGDKELAAGEKVARIRSTVQERVQPVLEATTAKIYEILDSLKAKKDTGKKKVAETYDHTEQETEIAAAAREHAQKAQEAGATYADAAKGSVEEKVNGDA